MHLLYLCVVSYNHAYQQGKNLNAAASLIHRTPEHARTTLEPTGYRSIEEEIDDPRNARRSVRTGRQEGLLTDRMTIDFVSLRK